MKKISFFLFLALNYCQATELDLDEIVTRTKKCFKSALAIQAIVHNKELDSTVKFFSENQRIVIPLKNASIKPVVALKNEEFFFCPIYKSDSIYKDWAQEFPQLDIAGGLVTDLTETHSKVISYMIIVVLNKDDKSLYGQGLDLIHETLHIKKRKTHPLANISSQRQEYLQEELEVNEKMLTFSDVLLGEDYIKNILKPAIIAICLDKPQKDHEVIYKKLEAYQDKFELKRLRTILYLESNFKACEVVFKGSAVKKRKMEFFETVYINKEIQEKIEQNIKRRKK